MLKRRLDYQKLYGIHPKDELIHELFHLQAELPNDAEFRVPMLEITKLIASMTTRSIADIYGDDGYRDSLRVDWISLIRRTVLLSVTTDQLSRY